MTSFETQKTDINPVPPYSDGIDVTPYQIDPTMQLGDLPDFGFDIDSKLQRQCKRALNNRDNHYHSIVTTVFGLSKADFQRHSSHIMSILNLPNDSAVFIDISKHSCPYMINSRELFNCKKFLDLIKSNVSSEHRQIVLFFKGFEACTQMDTRPLGEISERFRHDWHQDIKESTYREKSALDPWLYDNDVSIVVVNYFDTDSPIGRALVTPYAHFEDILGVVGVGVDF